MAALSFSQPARAKAWILKAEGVVTDLNVTNGLTNNVISLGDTIQLEIHFDTTRALADGPAASGRNFSRYEIAGARASLTVGKFSRNFEAGEAPLRVFLADQFDLGGGPTDYQSFSVLTPTKGGPRPFGLGDGNYNEWMELQAFDATGTQRSNTSIADLVPTSTFFSSGFSYQFFANGQQSGSIIGNVLIASRSFSWTLSSGQPAAIPEPAAWALMIVGFGMIGTAARRQARMTVSLA
jgi:hypothetical protein